MAEVSHNEPLSQDIDIDPDFEPQKRPRSCTWPLPRPESNAGKPESNDDIIPEEEDDDVTAPSSSSSYTVNNVNGGIAIHQNTKNSSKHPCFTTTTKEEVLNPTSKEEGNDVDGSSLSTQTHAVSALNGLASQPRKSSARRNAWGNYSYADLITQAIESSPDQRLTLSQIYEWMVRSVPYFKDKGDSNSSAGWKNSIRHNLSLHSRFMRVQNEGTGKSSWWMVNPEGGKGGKAPRRRAVSMDNSNKLIKGARGRAAKKKASLGLQAVQDGSSESLSLSSSLSKWTGSPTSRSSDELDAWTDFRSRTNSNASTISGRLSPILANPELDEALDDDSISPLSPMLYSSPSSLSPSTGPLGLADLALTMNLNDGLPDDLMGDLLDNISLTASQQPLGQEVESGGPNQMGSSVLTFSCSGGGSSSLGIPSSGSYGSAISIFQLSPPSSSVTSLRQSPMQTIQENHQASFSCLSSRFNHHHALQDLLSLETHGSHVSDIMLTHSDPLMSQASASVTLSQNSRRNAMLLRKDPMMSSNWDGAAGLNSQTSLMPGWRAQAGLSTPSNEVLCSSNDLDQQAKQLLQHLPSPSRNSSMQLGGSGTNNSTSENPFQLIAPDRFPIPDDLDLDVFNSSLDCDMDTIIRNELMDADCIDDL
ncbi:forkhead box protein O3 [Oncorhynchus tshawytscha]|uniref:Fork-head domain-containing protein n=1 Tax=Oncorhynchus tshawytscha TaxID=74940 RepID=A0A8C8FZQ7_ONCTS|nr:forkhead box protein O3 [Oncorhynchus tshawytscha]XP_024292651.1 forkhead box protein O3 [Oncorhynchus tshawytscha]XP_024292652.1 forkhead box protein O3 [Oncorhynchus tshawytscha]XP_024292653.1 forkhead box protein O3 [Oncorhynchus tshawytscha]XP_042185768.1 forkhead box protein O3 [Oncorhynchus tshawytscha]